MSKAKQPLLISAEEAAENARLFATTECMNRAHEICKAYMNIPEVSTDSDRNWVQLCALAAVYCGGRIQGIREERARRKGGAHNG
ncbi:MAG: hypothetical protein ACI4J2_00470 [Ruminococcus sp.]